MRCVPARPDLATVAALAVAVVAVSSSAPRIVYAAAPALAIAFWRNGLATAVLAPAVGVTRRGEVAGLGRTRLLLSVLAGVMLAAHFGTWVPSAKLTTVANSTALVATQPVWSGLIGLTSGRRLPRLVWIGMIVAVSGAVLATGADFTVSGRAVLGDVLALIGAVFAAAYVTVGERVRTAGVSTTTYTALCYGTCSVLLLGVCLTGGVRLAGYTAATWAAIGLLTLGPQLLGHSLFNFALRRVPATLLSVLILLEVPGATLIGWLLLGQTPERSALPGLSLLVAGVAVVVLGARKRVPVDPEM